MKCGSWITGRSWCDLLEPLESLKCVTTVGLSALTKKLMARWTILANITCMGDHIGSEHELNLAGRVGWMGYRTKGLLQTNDSAQ